MASAIVAGLEEHLNAMLALKPPGVSGSRIQSITVLCTQNVQSESVLIQKLYTHFKKAPGTHKLGVLYVVDSVTRKWTEQAKNAGQTINSAAEDGTYAAGVHRVKELLPVLMNDICQTAPDDQKEKIRKLVDIWEKGQTFPLQMLTSFKEKLNTQSQVTDTSTTPPGSPPSDLQRSLGVSSAAPTQPSAPNTSSILEALANMARQNGAAPANTQVQTNPYSVSNPQSMPAQQAPAMNIPFPPMAQPVNVPAAAPFPLLPQGMNGVQNFASSQTNPFAAAAPLVPPSIDPAMAHQLMLIQALAAQGMQPDQIAGFMASMGLATGAAVPPPPQFAVQNQNQNANSWGARLEEARDRSGYEPVGSPGNYRGRSRSRSPPRGGWNAHESPARRREEQNYDYGRDGGRGDDRGRTGGRGNEYRQRSPPRRGHSPTPPGSSGGGSKWIGEDLTIPKGSIKVLSRTLFVGGVTSSERELRSVFERFGKVQTCIVNKEKRHAFVKMVSRKDAVSAKEAMEKNRSPDSQLRTRWGVGFGPRDCSDYATGVSVIPISKLTDADRKWMLSAEYGGSGGKPIESNMVVEEPDIEIGQGVSSKAISRRMQTDRGGNNGPKSSRDRDEEETPRYRRGRDNNRNNDRDGDRNERYSGISGPAPMPAVPAFGMPGGLPSGFPFTMPTLPNGMPMLPPGFNFPGASSNQSSQPPAPGHRS